MTDFKLTQNTEPVSSPKAPQGDSQKHLDSYKKAQIETATPEKLLIMLYEGAIKFLTLAINGLDESDYELVHNNILKAEAIVLELMSVLDMDLGGELAVNLYNLYDFMYRQLIQANLKRDSKLLQDVIELLTELKSAWDEAADIVGKMRTDGELETPSGNHHFAG